MVALEAVLASADQEKGQPKAQWHKFGGERTADEVILRNLIEQHFRYTGSERAKALLADWTTARRKFVKVFPTEYKRALGEMYAKEQAARDNDREAVAA
jgi:glutamate synthase (NADPH/NADH) large chain